ncbi:MAG: toll/interleukin-1 receptor domain-containing protein [Bacteroidales bacterium]|nr:toll/interleukin-1 receptor domain-containing protein [Bacteroidales bacterium]
MEGNTNLPEKCINEGRPVYFSYARNSSRKPEWEHISDCMEPLLEAFRANNIEYRLDKRDIDIGDNISDFENEIGWKSEVVVIVFSDRYFRSKHCMYEFKQIKNALQKFPEKRLMCIKSGDFDLSDMSYVLELERYWGEQKQEYESIEYHRIRKHTRAEQAAWQNGFYLEDIRELYSFFSAINYSYAQSIDYGSFLMEIVKYYANTQEQEQEPEQNVYIQNPQPSNYVQTSTPVETNHVNDNTSYSEQPQNNKSSKWFMWFGLAIVILILFFIVASRYNNNEKAIVVIFAIFFPLEIFIGYKICESLINLTKKTFLKTILRICQWVGVIGASIIELTLLLYLIR